MAKKWQQLNADGKSEEAMALLEQIIVLSTPMFERLAMHEEFHLTVPLGQLISAAQEKVVVWLLKWDPEKGRLFSWMSKSLTGDAQVTLADGSKKRLDEIVENRLNVEVMSWNEKTKTLEAKPVTAWHKNPIESKRRWKKLSVIHPSGPHRCLYITGDHEVFTQRGWVEVDFLKAQDDLFLDINGKVVPVMFGLDETVDETNSRPDTDFNWRYDITVADNFNFLAENVVVHNCAKNAFRGEVTKTLTFREHIHTTDDSLERFFGHEDHAVDKHDSAEEVRNRIHAIASRWGHPQELGTLHFLMECIIEDSHAKEKAIQAASFAWGLSVDHVRFFYSWCVMMLRNAMLDKISVPMSEQDLFRCVFSYTFLPDFLNLVPWNKVTHTCPECGHHFPCSSGSFKDMCAVFGGQRIKFPHLDELAKLRENYRISQEMLASDLDPDAVSAVVKKYKKPARTAEQVFQEMTLYDSRLLGEHDIYDDQHSHNH